MLQSLHFTGLAPLYMNVLTLYMNVLTTLLLPHNFDVLLEKKCYLAKTSLMVRNGRMDPYSLPNREFCQDPLQLPLLR